MGLERKPAAAEGQPEYPDANEYSADRRGFLAMIGVVAAGAAGYFAYKAVSQPVAPPAGAPPVTNANTAPTPTVTTGTGSVSQPQGNMPGAPAVNVQAQPVQAQPLANPPGEASVQVKPEPVEPKVQAPGKVAVTADEKPEPKVNETKVVPPADPRIAVPGGVAPIPVQEKTIEPKTNIKGGAGMLVKRPNRRQA